jgi:hypothetical protein
MYCKYTIYITLPWLLLRVPVRVRDAQIQKPLSSLVPIVGMALPLGS